MTELDIFTAALALNDPAKQAAYLDHACADRPDLRRRLAELLSAQGHKDSPLDRPAGSPAAFAATGSSASQGAAVEAAVGKTVCPYPGPAEGAGTVLAKRYKLVEPIGEGGMGSVWVARQTEPVKRVVAVKLIKSGGDSKAVLARFEAERQALALMDHPNIAKVLDAGAAESGRPFFVMELVKGVPITEFCDLRKLTPRERLGLFIPVCQAVQHAHQKGIIHRDIKPSNVLVALYDDRPVPKVIDFGVAKAASQPLTDKTLMTGFGTVVGTPEYMSPEQASFNQLDVDTRSDVYALGVLLYELLTGSPPFPPSELKKAGLLEILRVIREQEPPRPSTRLSSPNTPPGVAAARGTDPRRLAGLVRGELDWIVMKALEKDRTRRYETANGFAVDVQRYLSGEPVQAVPPSTGYRLRKFVRRNRGPVLASALVLGVLLAGIIGTTLGLLQAQSAGEETLGALTRVSQEQQSTQQALIRVKDEEQKARAAEAVNRRIVARQYVTRGSDLLEQGNRTDALAWFVAALRADAPDPDREHAHRTRIGTTARMCPRPDRIWFEPSGQLLQCGFVPDGRGVFAMTAEGAELVVRVWDRATGAERFPPLRLPESWKADEPRSALGDPRLAFSADGRRFWTRRYIDFGAYEGSVGIQPKGTQIRVWDAASGRLLSSLPPDSRSPAFTPDGARLLTVRGVRYVQNTFAGGEAIVWDVDRNTMAYPPLRLEGGVGQAFLVAGGRRVVACNEVTPLDRCRIRLWNVADGTPVTDETSGRLLDSRFNAYRDDRYFLRAVIKPAANPSKDRPEFQTWDTVTGRPLGPPRDLGTDVATSNSGRSFGAGGRRFLCSEFTRSATDQSIVVRNNLLLDAKTWTVIRSGIPGSIPYGFSTDGRRFLTSLSETAVVRDAETGLAVGAEVPLRDGIDKFHFSPDGNRLLVFDQRRYGQVWDAERGVPVARDLRLDTGEWPAGIFAPDSRQVALWAGNQARIWDATNGQPITPVLVHPSPLATAEFSLDGFHLLTGCADGTVRTWPVTTGEPPARHLSHLPSPLATSIRFHPDGSRLSATLWFIGSDERRLPGGVVIWDRNRAVRLPDEWTSGGLYPYALDKSWGRIACWNNDAKPIGRVYDVATRRQLGPNLLADDSVKSTGFSPDGATLWAVSQPTAAQPGGFRELRAHLHLWDTASGRPRSPPLGPVPGQVPHVFFGQGGKLVILSTDQAIKAWETSTGRPIEGAFPDGAKVADVPNGGRWLTVRGPDDRILLWDLETGRALGSPLRLPGKPVWDPQAGHLWTVESSGPDAGRVARPRDLRTGEPLGPPARLPSGGAAWPLPGLFYEPSETRGTAVNLLDRATGRPTGVTLRHMDPIESLWFSSDARLAVTAVKSGREEAGYEIVTNGFSTVVNPYPEVVRVWDVATGELLAPPLRHKRGFGNFPEPAPDGLRVLTCPRFGEILLTDLAPDRRPAEVLARVAEGLSGRRLTEAGSFVPLDRDAHRAVWAELLSLLPPAPDAEYQPPGWHRGRAGDADRLGDYAAARFHLDRLADIEPDVVATHRDRARVALAQRDWSAAADSAERLTNLVPRDLTGWILRGKVEFSCEHFKDAGDYFQRAAEVARGADVLDEMDAWRYYLVARALDEDLPGYRAACAALIKQCTDRLPPQLILRWATLLPGGVDDLAPLVRLFKKKADADKKAEAERGNPQITVINLSIQAQAHLRTGEYAEVLKTITALEDIPHGLMGNDRLVRAMALYRVGRKAEAKKELEQARTWGRRFVAGSELMPASGRPLPDPMKLVYRIFFREAAEMIPE